MPLTVLRWLQFIWNSDTHLPFDWNGLKLHSDDDDDDEFFSNNSTALWKTGLMKRKKKVRNGKGEEAKKKKTLIYQWHSDYKETQCTRINAL